MKEENQSESNGPGQEDAKEVPASRRKNVVTGLLLALALLLILGLGFYLAAFAVIKDGF